MGTDPAGLQYQRLGQRYATDLTGAEFALIGPILRPAKNYARRRATDLRIVFNAFLYLLRNGCQCRVFSGFSARHSTQSHCVSVPSSTSTVRLRTAIALQALVMNCTASRLSRSLVAASIPRIGALSLDACGNSAGRAGRG